MWSKTSRDREVTDVYNRVESKKDGIITNNYFASTVDSSSQVVQVTGDVRGWRQLIADHIGATTVIQGTRRKVNSTRGYLLLKIVFGANLPFQDPSHDVRTYHWYGGVMTGSIPGTTTHASAVLAESRAAEQFLKKAQQALSSFQGGVFIAELGKAIHSIRNPAEALKRYLHEHVARAKRRRKQMRAKGLSYRRLNQAMSDMWLEAMYAWRPLVGDMESAAESLARIATLEEAKFVSAEGFDDWSDTSTPFTLVQMGVQAIRYKRRFSESEKCRFYGQVAAWNDVTPGSFAGLLTTRLGLNLAQALPTAWELIPFSFVADYFSNVGAMISAYSFPVSAIRWVNRATMSRSMLTCVEPIVSHTASSSTQTYEYLVDNPGSFKATTDVFVRTPFSAAGLLPSFRLEVPGIKDWPKWLNLAALANSIRT